MLHAGVRCAYVEPLPHVRSKVYLRSSEMVLCVTHALSAASVLATAIISQYSCNRLRDVRLWLCRASNREVRKTSVRASASGSAAIGPFSLMVVSPLSSSTSLAQVVGIKGSGHGEYIQGL